MISQYLGHHSHCFSCKLGQWLSYQWVSNQCVCLSGYCKLGQWLSYQWVSYRCVCLSGYCKIGQWLSYQWVSYRCVCLSGYCKLGQCPSYQWVSYRCVCLSGYCKLGQWLSYQWVSNRCVCLSGYSGPSDTRLSTHRRRRPANQSWPCSLHAFSSLEGLSHLKKLQLSYVSTIIEMLIWYIHVWFSRGHCFEFYRYKFKNSEQYLKYVCYLYRLTSDLLWKSRAKVGLNIFKK